MGHERVGSLPKTERWQRIVAQIDSATSEEATASLADGVLQAVKDRYRKLPDDPRVVASFTFLVTLAVSARASDPATVLRQHGINISDRPPDPLQLTKALLRWLPTQTQTTEAGEIASAGVADALAAYLQSSRFRQEGLFPEDEWTAWRTMSNGAGFCDISRHFFARFTERYLRYFLDREVANAAATLADHEQLRAQIRTVIDRISRHAFETARITQSFAAGWFNRHAQERVPEQEQIRDFLRIAFNKLRDEIRREATRT